MLPCDYCFVSSLLCLSNAKALKSTSVSEPFFETSRKDALCIEWRQSSCADHSERFFNNLPLSGRFTAGALEALEGFQGGRCRLQSRYSHFVSEHAEGRPDRNPMSIAAVDCPTSVRSAYGRFQGYCERNSESACHQ